MVISHTPRAPASPLQPTCFSSPTHLLLLSNLLASPLQPTCFSSLYHLLLLSIPPASPLYTTCFSSLYHLLLLSNHFLSFRSAATAIRSAVRTDINDVH